MADYKDMLKSIAGKVKDAADSAGVTEVYAKGAGRARAFGQMTKLNLDSNRDLEELKRVYAEIGRLYYEQAKDSPEGFFVPLFEQAGRLAEGVRARQREIDALKEPATIDFHGDVAGASSWKKGRPGKEKDADAVKLRLDPSHFNPRGHYLQACVWAGFLFGVDPTTFTYCPEGLPAADAKLMRECARDALKAGGCQAAGK